MEIKNMLPVMLETASRFPQYNFVIAGTPSIDESYYRQFMNGSAIPIEFGKTYSILSGSAVKLGTFRHGPHSKLT